MDPLRVLIAEDEIGVARLLQVLMRRRGYETQIAEDGAEALKCIQQRCPDLILLDLIMPVVSGYKLLEEIRSDPQTAHIPIVLVTTDENLSKVTVSGLEHVLKPFDPRRLDAAVERALAAAQVGS